MSLPRPRNVAIRPSFTLVNDANSVTYTFQLSLHGNTVDISRDEGKMVHIYTLSLEEARAAWSYLCRKHGFKRA